MEHLLVSFVIIERNDWNTIVDLEGKTVDAVVYYDHIFEVAAVEDSEIFDVVSFRCQAAVLTVESVFDELMVWINVVQDSISVHLVTGCEDNDLKVLGCFLQALHDVGSDVDSSVDCLFIWEVDLKDDIGILGLNVVYTVNECFVHVEYHKFFTCRKRMLEQ